MHLAAQIRERNIDIRIVKKAVEDGDGSGSPAIMKFVCTSWVCANESFEMHEKKLSHAKRTFMAAMKQIAHMNSVLSFTSVPVGGRSLFRFHGSHCCLRASYEPRGLQLQSNSCDARKQELGSLWSPYMDAMQRQALHSGDMPTRAVSCICKRAATNMSVAGFSAHTAICNISALNMLSWAQKARQLLCANFGVHEMCLPHVLVLPSMSLTASWTIWWMVSGWRPIE